MFCLAFSFLLTHVSFLIYVIVTIGHKFYSFVRQSEYIESIRNEVYNIDQEYESYKQKIHIFVENKDTKNLTKHLFWNPNIILSFITRVDYQAPFLNEINHVFTSNSGKFCLFYLNCLFHYSLILLNEENNDNNKFLKKVFNFQKCASIVAPRNKFWGVHAHNHGKNSVQFQIIELIMKQSYFNGFSQLPKRFPVCFIYFCVV